MRHRVFGRTGLRLSTIALGTATFGSAWGYGSKIDDARAIFRGYLEAGGDFIDTADFYERGQSEAFLGEFIGSARDEIVVGTKFSFGAAETSSLPAVGNCRKAMSQAVEASLQRLRTDRIDLLWVHAPDGVTPIDEILRGLDNLVRAGKVIYVGLSNFPAWRAAAAATMAEARAWAPISALQFEYSLVERTADREILPMATGFGLGTLAWSPLAGGLLTGKYRRGERGRAQEFGKTIHNETTSQETSVLDLVLGVAEELEATPGQVAIAWVMSKGIIPIIGPRTPAQLADNLGAAALVLSTEQIARLDEVSKIALGAPHEVLASSDIRAGLAGGHPELVDTFSKPLV